MNCDSGHWANKKNDPQKTKQNKSPNSFSSVQKQVWLWASLFVGS